MTHRRRPNSRWTIEKANAAMLAEAELIKRKPNPMKAWRLSEIEREYQLYQNNREWPES